MFYFEYRQDSLHDELDIKIFCAALKALKLIFVDGNVNSYPEDWTVAG